MVVMGCLATRNAPFSVSEISFLFCIWDICYSSEFSQEPRRYLSCPLACVELVELTSQLEHQIWLIYPWPNNLVCLSENDWTSCLNVTLEHSQGIVSKSSEAQEESCALPLALLGHSAQGLDLPCSGEKHVRIFNTFWMVFMVSSFIVVLGPWGEEGRWWILAFRLVLL